MGFHTSDDAAVYRINDEQALVLTADFITPPVDDPFQFGQIAAANAISDVYAMGGRPICALNLVSFPSRKLPAGHLHEIVAGALSKITESGAVLAGGHSVEDDEPKFGLSVTGLVHPDRYWANAGARSGDALVLTKPIGSGVLFNANLKGWVPQDAFEDCVRVVSTLNRIAAETLARFEVHAATDITGFALAGHALEIAQGSGVDVFLEIGELPVMHSALEMYRRGVSTGVNAENRRKVMPHARFESNVPDWHREIVFDPQTSGGLLAALPESQADDAVAALREAGDMWAKRVGSVAEPAGDRPGIVFR